MQVDNEVDKNELIYNEYNIEKNKKSLTIDSKSLSAS